MPQPIPVLLMVRELGIGGAERDLAKLAKAIDRSQFSPHVGCFVAEGLRSDELRAAGVPILHIPVRSFQSWSVVAGAKVLRRYLREQQIKIVHAFDVPTILFGVTVSHFSHVPVVISSHLGARELYSKRDHRLLRFVDRFADAHVANSKFIQQYLVDREHIPANRTHLCYNGVETAIFHPAPEAKPLAVAGASLVIGTLCALRPEKRVDLLLKAFAQIQHLAPGMKLLIVGSGPMLPQLETLRLELGLGKDCIFVPAQTDVAPWMRSLDIYVMCSESESFPNALLEAMACGCSVVGSRVGGIPELINDGVTGLLFESKNVDSLAAALSKLILDPALRRRFSEQAAAFARDNLSIEVNARRNESLYRSLLNQRSSA